MLDASDLDPALYREVRDAEGKVSSETWLLGRLGELTRMVGASLVVIDNASDAFDGDEIKRSPVRTFIRSLRQRLARPGRAVLLLAHVSKASASNRPGTGSEDYSGSTAYHNSARSRLSLTNQGAHGLRIEHMKSNLGPKANPVDLVWHEGVPLIEGYLTTTSAAVELSKTRAAEQDAANKAALVGVLQSLDAIGERVTSATQGAYTAYRALKGAAGFPKGLDADETNRLLRELQTEGRIFRSNRKTNGATRQYFTAALEGESTRIRSEGSAEYGTIPVVGGGELPYSAGKGA